MSDRSQANIKGYLTILLWSLAALCIQYTGLIPPFLLASLTSFFGFLMFASRWCFQPKRFFTALRQPLAVWLLFILAIIIYRATYLSALKMGPTVETNTIHYLWPLLIVYFSCFSNKKSINKQILLAALLSFLGVTLIGISKSDNVLTWNFKFSHLCAFFAALSWSSYSVLTKKLTTSPGDMIGVMHGIATCTFYCLHCIFEPRFEWSSLSITQIISVFELGLAISVGYSWWDTAMSRGDRDLLALRANLIPLLSTLWLVLFSHYQPNTTTLLGVLLVIGANMLVSKNES
jgi:drug/metabolite transporter (DMT)-like permease